MRVSIRFLNLIKFGYLMTKGNASGLLEHRIAQSYWILDPDTSEYTRGLRRKVQFGEGS